MFSNHTCGPWRRRGIEAAVLGLLLSCASVVRSEPLKCGAAAVDITPRHLPVIRNGGFLQAEDDRILDPLHARCIVLDDGVDRIAIVVVDSCMMPLSVCDEAKSLAATMTGIATDHIMISATHTHTAPSVMNFCLGSGIDQRYRDFLPGKIAEAIKLANDRQQPAKVGWARIDASNFTRCRRWITRTDKLQLDPFGERTVHANMHPGHLNPDFIGPSGPVDPWLSLLMLTDDDGRPLAVLANLSMHYYSGHSGVSADYYGRFAKRIAEKLVYKSPHFVGMMSQGTSGDLWWGDYSQPKDKKPFNDIDEFTDGLVALAVKAIIGMEYQDEVPVRIAEQRITFKRRLPDEKRLAWARRLNALRGDRLPKDRPEVYALQAVYMHENPSDEVVLQAIRIGDLGITGMPNEVYGLTGLKLRRRSPLGTTFNISLANGACGYIPPPEQHALGGYNTWPARTAGLEESAEPKIVDTVLDLLEQVANKPRKEYQENVTSFGKYLLSTKPYAYWQLGEMEQTAAFDASGNNSPLRFAGLVAYHLPGRQGGGFGARHNSHCVQLAGGKLIADNLALGESYSVQLSFFVGTPLDFRGTTATLLSRGEDELIITGKDHASAGRLAFGEHVGRTALSPDEWHQVVYIRNGDFVQVFFDGSVEAEISAKVPRSKPSPTLMVGGNAGNTANLEGKLDDVSVYDRAVTAEEVAALFRAAAGDDSEGPIGKTLDSSPLDVESSRKRIHVREGYHVELVAAEPMVQDPVAIDWGADGKLWVAEMADYPMGMDGNGKPGGRIRYLEDTDGDGSYNKSTVFLQNVSFPNGVMAWRNGVLVTAAPEIFYAEDTTGDGKADLRETLLSGFMQGNQQLRVNGLRWGLDNLVHCASGAHHAGFGAGNAIFSSKRNESTAVGSRDFRFDPNTGFLDPQSGPSQYGRVRNDFGDWFGVQNSQPLWHYVLADQYLRRNGEVPSIDPRQQVRVPRMPEVYSAKPPQRRFHGFDHAGHYTSACGISIYRDDLLFPREEQHAFTCEPFHNLVQHHVLRDYGTSFQGERADDGPIDFFASSDRWTRPVMTRTGPDGALWIVDMYRYMIEHPQWLPKEGQDALRPGFRAGEGLGRIYRIVPDENELRPIPQLQHRETSDLVELLTHPNGIVRDMAHRLLINRECKDTDIARIREIAKYAALPESRIQSLSVLDGLGACDATALKVAAADKSPAVCRHAICLAEKMDSAEVRDSMLRLVDDPNPKVRLHLAASLGEWQGDDAGYALARLAIRDDGDEFINAAIISSLPKHYVTVADSLTQHIADVPESVVDAILLMGESNPVQLARVLEFLMAGERHNSRLAHWLDTLAERNKTFHGLAAENVQLARALAKFQDLTKTVRSQLLETGVIHIDTIRLLGREPGRYKLDVDLLAVGLSSKQSIEVQAAVAERLASIRDDSVPDVLVTRCPNLLPQIREKVVVALLSRRSWQLKLIDAVETGQIFEVDLSLAQRRALLESKDQDISTRSGEVFVGTGETPRSVVVQEYAVNMRVGDPEAGRKVFEENCKVCHMLDRQQQPVGPDLRSVTNRSTGTFLTSILDPSQTIEPKYLNYTFVLKNGKSIVGIVTEEGGSSLKVVDAEGKSRTLMRASIDSVHRASKSIMPEGFESKIGPSAMSDLIAFLQAI